MNRDTILQAAANGNAQALEFLRVFARRAHWVDDIADGAKGQRGKGAEGNGPAPQDGLFFLSTLARYESEWLLCLASNPFFLAHRAQLVPQMILALNAWEDSEAVDWDSTDIRDVLKAKWHDVVWLVAWLVGGTEHLRNVTREHRSFDLEPTRNGERASRPDSEAGKEANGLSR